MTGIFFLFCFAYLSRTPLAHSNVVVNLNGKGLCLYIPLPILADLPIKGHHYVWPYYCCLDCSQSRKEQESNPKSHSVAQIIYLKVHAAFCTLDFSMTMKYCSIESNCLGKRAIFVLQVWILLNTYFWVKALVTGTKRQN